MQKAFGVHYRFDGAYDAPVVMLSNSLGTNLAMWDSQIPVLTERYRVLRYDSRGHGHSTVTPGPYSIEQLARDAVALLDALGLTRVRFCGLSLGGMVGQWLGANAAPRLSRLVLCNTAAYMNAHDAYDARIDAVTRGGMAAVADGVLARWYTAQFIAAAPDAIRGDARDAVVDPCCRVRRIMRCRSRHGSARFRNAHCRTHPRHRRFA